MPDDVTKEDDAIELADLSVERVDGVKGPATGQSWLVMKALNDAGQEQAPEAQNSDAGARAEHLNAHAASHAHAHASNLDTDDKANAHEANEEAEGRSDDFSKADVNPAGQAPRPQPAGSKDEGQVAQERESALGTEGVPNTPRDQMANDANAECGSEVDIGKQGEGTGVKPGVHGVDKSELSDVEKAAVDYFEKRDFSADKRKQAAKEGAALPDGSFPIYNQGDLDNALHLAGKAKDPGKAKAHIRKRAKSLKLKIPEDSEVNKADDPDSEPGSPAWEAKDAATLRQAAQQLVQASQLVDQAYGRECAETDNGDTADWADVSDLDCAKSALDCALGIVARLSFTEGAEGAPVAKSDALVRNTVAALKTHPLLAQGSDRNEEINVTGDELQSLLADQTEQLAKQFEERMDARFEKALGERLPTDDKPDEPVEKADESVEDVEKADKAKPKAKADDDDDDADDKKPAVEKSESANTDTTPTTSVDGDVLKSVIADAFKAAAAEDGVFGSVVKQLEERVDKMERQPMPGGPIMRGAEKLANNALVALRDDPSSDTPEMSQLRKSMDAETDPVKKADIGRSLTIALARQFAGG